jgi:hypothetical protein
LINPLHTADTTALKHCSVSIPKFSAVSMEHISSLEAQSPSASEETPGLLLNINVRHFYTALLVG